MRDDAVYGGQQAYRDMKRILTRGQRCLCAYCERRIAEGTTDAELDARRDQQCVEHFHPKEDKNHPPNWALHWPNLWAVCDGGAKRPPAGEAIDATRYLPPLPENLSCDAFKGHQIRTGKLDMNPDGWILRPDEIPAFPPLFQFDPYGRPEAHLLNCAALTQPKSRHPNTATLVSETIRHLNLGCPRLNRNRFIAKKQLEKQIEQVRKRARGMRPRDAELLLARRLFSQSAESPWPEYFTLIRWRLREAAEEHLRAIQFDG
jgi:uncharacterized protein (TIGR02646 family)